MGSSSLVEQSSSIHIRTTKNKSKLVQCTPLSELEMSSANDSKNTTNSAPITKSKLKKCTSSSKCEMFSANDYKNTTNSPSTTKLNSVKCTSSSDSKNTTNSVSTTYLIRILYFII